MTPEQLKASILQMAIQGKLVEQRAEEGNAEELLSYIRSKKDKKIKNGEIKPEKLLKEVNDEEMPFDIPERWKWVRLGDYCEKITDQVASGSFASLRENVPSLKEPNYAIMVKTADFANGFSSNLTYTTEHGYNFLSNSHLFGGELILSNIGSVGKCFIVPNLPNKMTLAPNAIMLRLADNSYRDYLYYFFLSRQGYSELMEISSGTTMKKFNKTDLKNILVPVPPLEEQHRIVAKIEELLPYVDRYATSWEKLEHFNAKFPEDMRKSILQYAIQGKLVEQRQEEGTAEELYQQIQAEKQKLIKEGKIKKEKPLPEIAGDEIPFDIPKSWKWVRMSDVIDVRDGTHDTPGYVPIGYPLITGKDFYNGYFELSKTKYISEEDYNEIKMRSQVDIGDILFSMIGGNIGSMIEIAEENYFDMAIKNVALFKQYNYERSLTKYLFYFLKSQVSTFQTIAKGGAQSFVSLNMLRNYLIPFPPLAEQHRIVAKIEKLLPYCDRLVKK
jgi:type I restriction enzyme S subunit